VRVPHGSFRDDHGTQYPTRGGIDRRRRIRQRFGRHGPDPRAHFFRSIVEAEPSSRNWSSSSIEACARGHESSIASLRTALRMGDGPASANLRGRRSDTFGLWRTQRPRPRRAQRRLCARDTSPLRLLVAGVQGSRTLRGHRRAPASGFEVREAHRSPSTPTNQVRKRETGARLSAVRRFVSLLDSQRVYDAST